eukprot:TRINITY_DN477_c1_g1_i1.p1 TRINITY_DN477_c1_g1~~TRINITY_DN477_c1_g1_i1.p1  ORF type:complete len:379 (-),score=110.38 TRINITY_DN477_c1_g1_i1:204-1340(-)
MASIAISSNIMNTSTITTAALKSGEYSNKGKDMEMIGIRNSGNSIPISNLKGGMENKKIKVVSSINSSSLNNNNNENNGYEFIQDSEVGLKKYAPSAIQEGNGGAYIFYDVNNKPSSVFKPLFEDPMSVEEEILFKGVRSEEVATREVLASKLDNMVPTTVLVDFLDHQNSKKGSLQKFVPNASASWDFGSSIYNTHDVHKVGILDIRIANLDRHGGNILATNVNPSQKDNRNFNNLVPIDHSYSLPDIYHYHEISWFEWLTFKQSKAPFSEEAVQFINNINISEDIRVAKSLGIRSECITTLKVNTIILKQAVANRLTLHQIGKLICSPNPSKPSPICLIIKNLLKDFSIETELSERKFLNKFSETVSVLLSQSTQH